MESKYFKDARKTTGYKSPIFLEYGTPMYSFERDLDKDIYQAVLRVGIHVDVKELQAALEYDRGQYETGYDDCRRDLERHGHWEKIPGSFSDHRRCSNCHYDPPDDGGTWEAADSNECAVSEFTFCPNCGAKMDEEESHE